MPWVPDTTTPISILGLPWQLDDISLPDGVCQIGGGRGVPDLVILTERNAVQLLTSRLSPAVAAIVPVVDVSPSGGLGLAGTNARWADLSMEATSRACLAEAAVMLQPAIERMRLLLARIPSQ